MSCPKPTLLSPSCSHDDTRFAGTGTLAGGLVPAAIDEELTDAPALAPDGDDHPDRGHFSYRRHTLALSGKRPLGVADA